MAIHASGGSGCCFALPRGHLDWFHRANNGFPSRILWETGKGMRLIVTALNPSTLRPSGNSRNVRSFNFAERFFGLRVGQPTAAGSHEWVDTSLLYQTAYHTLIWYTLILLIPNKHIWNSWDSPEASALENKTCVQLCEQNMLRS